MPGFQFPCQSKCGVSLNPSRPLARTTAQRTTFSSQVVHMRTSVDGLRSILVLAVVVVLSAGLLGKETIPLWSDARKALPVVVSGEPKEQVGERGELDELLATVSRRSQGPVLFLAPSKGEHLSRAFFAAYALFPKRVVYAVPEPNQSSSDSWVFCDLTADGINRLAADAGAGSAIFWKTPVPPGFDDARETLTFSDQRSVVFLR